MIAEAAGADFFESRPEIPYTNVDLNWMDKKSRSTVEMNEPSSRPAIAEEVEDMEQYDKVIARIHEVAKYVPLDRLYLSPQCGFTSCEICKRNSGIWSNLSDGRCIMSGMMQV